MRKKYFLQSLMFGSWWTIKRDNDLLSLAEWYFSHVISNNKLYFRIWNYKTEFVVSKWDKRQTLEKEIEI